jgi:hypothetical protein
MSPVSRAVSAAGWLSLLAAIAVAFIVQGRIGAAATESSSSVGDSRSGDAALGLLIVGLACAGIALLL